MGYVDIPFKVGRNVNTENLSRRDGDEFVVLNKNWIQFWISFDEGDDHVLAL